ncbi:MAG: VWA domain-containing protein [Clostridiaceae bacterium]|jgi:Ca-activated chloride channel family protein|nr:VWA domain-containing protein [Clostridiaceae bacterium]
MRILNWPFLLLIPLIIFLFFFYKKKGAALKFPSINMLMSGGMKRTILHKIGRYLMVLGLLAATAAMARPQSVNVYGTGSQSGIDIVVLLDVSISMQSIDFKPNRLEVAKDTIDSFITKRSQDRIALVVFKATAHTLIPLTHDHNILRDTLRDTGDDSVVEDGTAIGMAMVVGLNRLKNSDAASKVIILVTDGENNSGDVNPGTAAEMARELGIKVYPIGVGTDKMILPIEGTNDYETYPNGIDEDLMKHIAEITGGKYYRVNKSHVLSDVFSDIDKLEKTEFEQGVAYEYTELGFVYIKIALIFLALGIFMDRFLYIRIP